MKHVPVGGGVKVDLALPLETNAQLELPTQQAHDDFFLRRGKALNDNQLHKSHRVSIKRASGSNMRSTCLFH